MLAIPPNSVSAGSPPRRWQWLNSLDARITSVLIILSVALIYFAAAELGLSLAFIHANVSPVWPPTGVAIAAILLLGSRAWPGILIGAFAANFLTPVPLGTTMGIAIGNTLEALVAARLLHAVGFQNSFDRAKHVTWFVVSLMLGTMVGATLGTISLCLGHAASWQNFGSLWSTWWLGDLVGGLVLVPLFLAWGTRSQQWLPNHRRLEAILLLVMLWLTDMVIFGGWFPTPVKTYPLAHLALPFLVWAAFRLGQRGLTLALLLLAAIAIWGTRHGFGPFARGTPNESLLLVQVFVGASSVMFMFLVSVVDERRLAAKTLRLSERRVGANLAVTRILAESPALSDATPRILQTISETLRWEVGGLWIPDSDFKALRCLNIWHTPGAEVEPFKSVCLERTFPPGVGLPGRVWTTLQPAWIPDVAKDDNFPRAPFALAADLHAAFAFPILFNEKFLGVMEFFSREIREPDEALLAMFGSIGGQIGQFMERKRNEEEREQLLSRELAARAEAELANRTKDEFLAVVSHELRTPLNAIVGWASMLRSGSLDQARAFRAIEVIDRNAKAQAQLIEDILDVSRIVSGNLRLDPRPVHLQQVIEAAIDSIRPAAETKQIRLETTIDREAGPVSGDPDRLQQVVWNLLANAVKFTPSAGRIEVRLTSVDSHVEIVVSDNGQGIHPEFLPHVFDRFRQADGSKTRRHGGLGLGLAIVRNLVELHGGTVKANSDGDGKGTVFTITLPCMGVSTKLSARQQQMDLSRISDKQPELSNLRILTVEDDSDSREMLEMVLRSQGADVVSAGSVREALQVLDGNDWRPQVLVSDLGMPDEDGYDLITKIRTRAADDGGKIPAIAITGYAGNEEGRRALRAGFQRHLTKPVNWSELVEAIAILAKDSRS
jgi:signal transduction histidine kinase/integral membrane sensor domain MASE1/ActR/RegA family two-component response regulator